MIRRLGRWFGTASFFLVILLLLAIQIAPHFLDRVYYRGPASSHYDGERFSNPDGDDVVRVPSRGGRAGFLLRELTGSDGRPAWPLAVPVTPSRPAARVSGDAMVATWVGHATVLVQTQGLNILTDPVWADRAGPLDFGPRRVARPGIRFEDLPPIDLVLVSHNHYDHMDLPALKRLWDRDRPLIVTSLGNDTLMKHAGIGAVTALDWGQQVGFGPGGRFAVAVTRNHHWGSRWYGDRNRALWSSFVMILPGGNVFFAGDTGPGDLKWVEEARRLGPVRLALLPIGAFRFEPGQMVTGAHVGPIDSAEIFARLGATTGIPIHWGTFRLSFEGYDTPPRLLAEVIRCRPDIGGRFAAAAFGQPVTIPPLGISAAPRIGRDQLVKCLDTPAVRALR